MSPYQPIAGNDEHRVLQFRPRSSETLRDDAPVPVDAEEPDEFRHRMWTNAAALAFTAALVGFGVWLAISIGDLRKSQDCVLIGRRDCAQVSNRVAPAIGQAPMAARH